MGAEQSTEATEEEKVEVAATRLQAAQRGKRARKAAAATRAEAQQQQQRAAEQSAAHGSPQRPAASGWGGTKSSRYLGAFSSRMGAKSSRVGAFTKRSMETLRKVLTPPENIASDGSPKSAYFVSSYGMVAF